MTSCKTLWMAASRPVIALAIVLAAASARAEDPPASSTTSSTSETVVERVTTVRETTTTQTTKTEAVETPVAAIFIKNRASDYYDDKVPALADLVSARVTDLGMSVIDREDAINAVASFADEGANAGDEELPGADLDALMSNQASATRLAQMLGADYVMVASIVSINDNVKHFEGYGTQRTIFEGVMNVSYKVLDRVKGASITGGVVKATVKRPFQAQASETDMNVYMEESGIVDEMLDLASIQLTEQLATKLIKVRQAKPGEAGLVEWTIICGTTDVVVPTVIEVGEAEDFVIGEQKLPVNPTNVTIELNGAVIGTAPGTFQVPPGLSKLRLTREGYKDFERVVNVAAGQTLRIDLQMTDEEYARWKDMTAFLQGLKEGAKLTDAQEEAIRGFAQTLRQSGFLVNYQANTTEGIRSINTYNNSPYLWPSGPAPVQPPVPPAPEAKDAPKKEGE